MNCIRRPGARWTSCTCEQCKALTNRTAKHWRAGRGPIDRRPEALERLKGWVEAGYSDRTIASMTGVHERTLAPIRKAILAGRTRHMEHVTADKILSAKNTPTGNGWIPSLGTVRRLQALTVMGWSMRDLAGRYDVQEPTLAELRNGKHASVRPKFARLVERIYDELAEVEGPSNLAKARAINRGWFGPQWWDNPDDPAENPTREVVRLDTVDEVVVQRLMEGITTEANRAEKREAFRRLAGAGYTVRGMADRLGVTTRSIQRWREEMEKAA